VGIHLRRSPVTYASILGALKAGAAFVPIDVSMPADRVGFIAQDAELDLLLTSSALRPGIADVVAGPILEVDGAALGSEPITRPLGSDSDEAACYVMYTSGSTGRPKGVEVSHASVCNFLRVVEPIYGIRRQDRVYQGMTIAFDFSIEEIWPTWLAGAALVPGPSDDRRLGPGLAEFLTERRVTVMCAVPTLLASLDRDVPSLRLLNVGGESCPPELVARWSRPGRRMLNTYGPTEATVTATWSELRPNHPVTIGRPLPTYSVRLLDDELCEVEPGEVGEICIGGPGLARGYVGLPELSAERFIPDPTGEEDGRLYRTGDLGRLTPTGEIEFAGRKGSEVKLRGYRIDLQEIEGVLLEDEGVGGAAVAVHDRPGLGPELAAFVTRAPNGGEDPLVPRLARRLRDRLPGYMVPAYLEIIECLPRLASGKVDRARLPAPRSARLGATLAPDAPAHSERERELATLWCEALGLERVSVDADFFLDLGGHSLAAAIVVSSLRRTPGCDRLAIADLYAHPTIRRFAAHLEATCERPGTAQARPEPTGPAPSRPGGPRILGCGLAQALLLYVTVAVAAAPLVWLLRAQRGWASAGQLEGLLGLVPAVVMAMTLVLPVVGSRLLLAGLRPGRYRLWGVGYLRWWLARKLLAAAPLPMLSGSPLLPPYLRLLGARVGRGCHLATASIDLPRFVELGQEVCVGAGAVIQAHVVQEGWLTIAPVCLGDRSFVGANAVVLAGASLGQGSGLAEQSLAAAGQDIAPGEWWAGSPSSRQRAPDPVVAAARAAVPAPPSRWSLRLVAAFMGGLLGLELLPWVAAAPAALLVTWATVRAGAWGALAGLAVGAPLYVGCVCAVVLAGVRGAGSPIREGTFALRSGLGVRKWLVDKLLERSLALTNTLYATLYATPWLRGLGARVGPRSEVSTLAHFDPVLLELGEGSFVADLASVGPATYTAGRIVLRRSALGRRSFVGNAALLRAGTSLGAHTLVGAHTLAPEGEVAPSTSWLGSPAIFLPRRQDSGDFPDRLTYSPSRGRVAGRLAIEYLRITLPALVLGAATVAAAVAELRLAASASFPVLLALTPVVAAAAGAAVALAVALLKWAIVGRYRPRTEPLWSTFVRRTELVTGLYEAAAVPALLAWLTGTPFAGPALRLFGARIGRRVWMDTTYVTEFDLVTVHDDAAIGSLTSLQTHLFEDRVMKMSRVSVGPGSSIGSRSIVLYDSEIESGATLDALSLVMKGERLPAGTRWRGIPAAGLW